jgi:predicted DNA-binding protein (UPF0251 family)
MGFNVPYNRKARRYKVMRIKMTFYNERTGEILAEEDRVIIFGKKPYIDKGFVKFFVAFLRDMIEDEEVLKGPIRLFLYAVDLMDYEDLQVTIVSEKAMKDLGIGRGTFYRWLKVLLKKDYMKKIATNVYKLRPFSAIKGQMSKALKSEPDF